MWWYSRANVYNGKSSIDGAYITKIRCGKLLGFSLAGITNERNRSVLTVSLLEEHKISTIFVREVTTVWIKAAVGKTLFIPRHSLNAFSGPRQSWTLELVEASKSGLPILLLVNTRQSHDIFCRSELIC